MHAIKHRLRRLEQAQPDNETDCRIMMIIGKHYDELSDAEKDNYCHYRGQSRETIESLELTINGTLHFICDEKPKPLSPAEQKERREVLEALVNECIEDYNRPEAIAQRKRKYDEIRRIGELRKAAYYRGEPMSEYPLPWETHKE